MNRTSALQGHGWRIGLRWTHLAMGVLICSSAGVFKAQADVTFLQDGLIVSKRMDIVIGLDAQHGKGKHYEFPASVPRLPSRHDLCPAMRHTVVLVSQGSEGVRTRLQVCIWLHGEG